MRHAASTHVHLRTLPFFVVWLGIGVIHAVSATAMYEMRELYASLPYTSLGETLGFIQLGIAPQRGGAVARVLDALIVLHIIALTSMARLRNAWLRVFGRHGVLGVEGAHFDSVLLAREAIETSLQSLQAYRMSRYVGRQWLNWMYVALLVLNCWGVPFLHFAVRRHKLRRRLWCLFCDTFLDFVASVAVPAAIFVRYKNQYNPVIENFDLHLWYDDVWAINVVYDFQLVLFVSWTDLVGRVFMALSLVTSLESIKRLVRLQVAVVPQLPALPVAPSAPMAGSIELSKALLTKRPHSLHRLAHRVFALWGFLVLAFHLHAQLQPSIVNCGMQLRPWMVKGSACALPVVDCVRLGINGRRDEISTAWRLTYPAAVNKLVIRHCEALEIPPDIDRFVSLTTVKVYNSTIASWSEDAALRHRTHPALFSLTLVRVTFPDGALPLGVIALDGPLTLRSIQICSTNLQQLPPDLDERWPVEAQLLIEDSHLDEFPVVLTRLRPTHLSLAYSRISSFAMETVLSWKGLQHLSLAGNTALMELSVPSLNTSLPAIETLNYLVFSQTNVAWLPWWFDRIFERGLTGSWTWTVLRDTPFCTAVDLLRRHNISALGETMPTLHNIHPQEVSKAMAVTRSELPILDALVDCNGGFLDGLFYPIWYDDLVNGLLQR
ncbi:hypothetical protein P43SY_006572 [Pythium insidiosum]|uniref:Transmembrane protein n=1 Tax=Pythium insidiosum TaxID=114742 RepID=A0AAD5LB83_PYTIN|nr:hypothetical protein P43SY_006572 [Pythium insidiosum]